MLPCDHFGKRYLVMDHFPCGLAALPTTAHPSVSCVNEVSSFLTKVDRNTKWAVLKVQRCCIHDFRVFLLQCPLRGLVPNLLAAASMSLTYLRVIGHTCVFFGLSSQSHLVFLRLLPSCVSVPSAEHFRSQGVSLPSVGPEAECLSSICFHTIVITSLWLLVYLSAVSASIQFPICCLTSLGMPQT